MKKYLNKGYNSGIVAYEHDGNKILVKFHDGWVYEYRRERIGDSSYDKMVQLAEEGAGLNSYINRNRNVSKGFSNKFRA